MLTCPSCGEQNPERARFCLACATPLESEAERPQKTRKTVTILFSDMVDSTPLGERLDPEALQTIKSRYFDEVRSVLERHGGTVEKFIGDAVMAAFGIPVVHEDDALRAVRAASEVREAVSRLNEALQSERGLRIATRTGINTGEVVAGDSSARQSFATGDAVNVAARLEQAAGAGEILIGETTYRLVRDAVQVEALEPLALKGKAEGVRAYKLLEVAPSAPGTARRLDSPLVGRERERAQLRQAFDRAVEERMCHLFTLLGPAGVGKSRLVAELVRELGEDATVLRGRCLSYGEGITFWPLVEILRQLGAEEQEAIAALIRGADPDEHADRIATTLSSAIGLGQSSATADEIFWAFRKLLEALSQERPVVLVLDDVHWGERVFLDLVEHVADWSRDAPILVICVARPELLDDRSGWGGGKLNASSLLLGPLTDSESTQLIENLLGRAPIPDGARRRITSAAEGNPLFVEEMLAMLIDVGCLERQNGSWVAAGDLAAVTVPPTIQALLAARLDQLNPGERHVIERAAVEGKLFHLGAVVELSPADLRDDVGAHLMALVRRELIRPGRGEFPGEDGFRFRHLLVRDSAYEALPKEQRAELHERFADWLERKAEGKIGEYEEILGHHLEQAYRYRAELGPIGPRERELARRAAQLFVSSARRASGGADVTATRSLLSRSAALLPPDDPVRVALLPDLAAALHGLGEYEEGNGVLNEAFERARASKNERVEARAQIVRLNARLQWEPHALELIEPLARALPEVFERLEDESGQAASFMLLSMLSWHRAHAERAMELSKRALHHARRANDSRLEFDATMWLATATLFGPTPVAEGLRRLDELAGSGNPWLPPLISNARAGLEAMIGRFDDARRSLANCLEAYEQLGHRVFAAAIRSHVGGKVEMLAGNPSAAERHHRDALEEFERMGEKGYLSTTAAHLGEVVYAQGRFDEAESLARMSEQAGSPDDVLTQTLLRAVRAKVLAQRGRAQEANTVVLEAVALAESTDWINVQGDVYLVRAEVAELSGQHQEAAAARRKALDRYELKGNLVSAERTRRLLAEVG
ncbi:MAG: AAA family ATPase [Actinobacteria bacterium]|nr:AAA family ATPase [Actinomycetota bacterium]